MILGMPLWLVAALLGSTHAASPAGQAEHASRRSETELASISKHYGQDLKPKQQIPGSDF